MFPSYYNRNPYKYNPRVGSLNDKTEKLKEVKADEPKYVECPGCGKNTCYYLGVTPCSVKCVNEQCKWFESLNEKNE